MEVVPLSERPSKTYRPPRILCSLQACAAAPVLRRSMEWTSRPFMHIVHLTWNTPSLTITQSRRRTTDSVSPRLHDVDSLATPPLKSMNAIVGVMRLDLASLRGHLISDNRRPFGA
ncbi:hypothetical protein PAXRUDRAFT_546155 [Paxillus rubicundulus Ve08.2h10]|uniref:Uncharacterized protein n=1 Tax=Paxillus rubicundulus Ve08.2h10 TaxID=930991 RepID=A0A0D0DMR9_9AGAM|nr:hypothetical protein PAXRUDRAFT_546155 [Paxillus rubicundulus Ve08.2h10]